MTDQTEPAHVCKPGATVYFCPTSGQTESDCHGGFEQCCDRLDLHRPVTESIAVTSDCEHHYETRILGGHPITVRACIFCRTPDWPDLNEQAENLYRWGREEALAGKPPRERLSAYDMPR